MAAAGRKIGRSMKKRQRQSVWPSSKSNQDWRPTEAELRPTPHPFRDGLDLELPPPPRRKKPLFVLAALLAAGAAAVAFIVPALAPDTPKAADSAPLRTIPAASNTVRLAGSRFIADKAVAALAKAMPGSLKIDAQDASAADGLAALLRNKIDFWMTTRPVADADLDAARAAGIPNVPTLPLIRRPGIENQIGWAGIVLIANLDNPVRAISPAQTVKVFTGKTTAWAQLGGQSNLPVGRFALSAQREETGWFCAAFMDTADPVPCLRSFGLLVEPAMDSPRALAEKIADSPAGIGFAAFGDSGRARPMAFGTSCGTPIAPTRFRIAAGDYPATRPLYLYAVPGRTMTRAAKAFLDFATGPAGQAAIASSGLVDMSPVLAETADRDPSVARAATDGATRLSVTFRFPHGEAALAPAAGTDIARLIAWIRQPGFAKSQIVAVGHTEPTEDDALALGRAEAVRARLRTAGLRDPLAVGAGSAAPIACPTDPLTAALNRRR